MRPSVSVKGTLCKLERSGLYKAIGIPMLDDEFFKDGMAGLVDLWWLMSGIHFMPLSETVFFVGTGASGETNPITFVGGDILPETTDFVKKKQAKL